jgi:osmoprotectant transport system permease protein
VSLILDAARWLADPAHWSGAGSIPLRVAEHLQVSLVSVLFAALLAVPAGLYIGHTRRGEWVVTSIANLGRAIPSFAILALALPFTIRLGLGLGFWPTVLALWALAIPPILTNCHVGVREVDRDTRESALAMGMTHRQVLTRLELPVAAPLIAAGLRTATVHVVATATLAALVAWGGLGRFIIDGFAVQDQPMILGGAILVAGLATVTDAGLGLVERAIRPGGMPGPVQG